MTFSTFNGAAALPSASHASRARRAVARHPFLPGDVSSLRVSHLGAGFGPASFFQHLRTNADQSPARCDAQSNHFEPSLVTDPIHHVGETKCCLFQTRTDAPA